jgi:hypothetical protein
MSKNILLTILEYFGLGMEFFHDHFDFIDLINHSPLQLSFILKFLLYHPLSLLHQAALLYLNHSLDHFPNHFAHFIMILKFDFLQYLHSVLIDLH